MPTTGWSSCGARPARCSRACWISAAAARSSRAPSATSWCAPASPVSISSTSATRLSTSAASTVSPSRGTGADGPALGESFHIGRLAVSGPDHEPLVVDWRAPVAEPFYRATGLDPQGLARRRHLAVRGRTVLGLEDEYFVDPDGRPAARPDAGQQSAGEGGERLLSDGMVLGGPGALLSALGQARTGHMGDIVGTIQREQDEIIRSPLAGRARRPGWSRHGQDGGRPAPRRLPALHAPLPTRAPGRARRRAEPVVPALHRAGPALAGRDGRQPLDGGRARARGARPRRRRPGRRQAEGRRADGEGAGPGRAHPPAAAAPRRRDPLRCRRAAAARARRPRRSSRSPAGGRAPTTPAGVSSRRRWCARCPTSTGPGSAGAVWRHRGGVRRRAHARGAATTWRSDCAGCPR